MADDNNEDDSWLYGSSNVEDIENQELDVSQADGTLETTGTDDVVDEVAHNNEAADENNFDKETDGMLVDGNITEASELNGGANTNGDTYNGDGDGDGDADGDGDEEKEKKSDGDGDDDDDSDDEDDIVVTIGSIQPAASFNIKQRGALAAPGTAAQDKPKTNLGKFSIEEFESVGTIAGQSAVEYNIEAIEDKPWRKPGADITDYFNYGFSEETWRAYCERQKKMRHESGVGLSGLNPQQSTSINNSANRTLTSLTTSDNSKYSGSGSSNSHSHSGPPNFLNRSGFGAAPEAPAKENVIQVMTAERREYSRPKGKFDVSMTMPPPPFNMANEPFYPEDNFSYGYEPTQEQQWNNDANVGWMPSGIKELTPGPQTMVMPPPPMNMNMPPPNAMMPPNMMNVPPQMVPPPQHNMNINIPPMPNPMMPPPVIPPTMPPNRDRNEDHRNNQNDYNREHDDKRGGPSTSSAAWRPREKERDYRERERDEESRRDRERYRSDRERDRGSSRRDRSRSRERTERRRRSKSRESSRKSRDKKKSHKKDKDDSD